MGNGAYSVMHGPFVSYPEGDLPVVTVAAHPAGPDAIRVSWSLGNSTCFVLDSISVSCGSLTASEGEGNSRLVTGLLPDTEYSCSVSGVLTEKNKFMADTSIEVMAEVTIRAITEGV